MATHDGAADLCSICSTIDVRRYFSPNGEDLKDPEETLGTWHDVRNRIDCKLCRLAVRSHRRNTRPSFENDDATVATYDEYTVQLRRRVFATTEEVPGAEWRVTNRNWYSLPPHNMPCSTAYCMTILLTPPNPEDGTLWGNILSAEDSHLDSCSSGFFQRRSVQPERSDIHLAARWLRICSEEHGKLCAAPEEVLNPQKIKTPPLPEDMVIIDVRDKSLCYLQGIGDFLTLSYRWPNETYLLERSASDELFESGGLLRIKNKLPAIFWDAVECTEQLGERFLWIDALCIFQDDELYKTTQIAQMSRIYRCSKLTLIAAAGPSSPVHCGLPGFRARDETFRQEFEQFGSLTLAEELPSLEDRIQHSSWSERAWTFQEQLLSRRKLYFTGHQLFFQCSCSIFGEDIASEKSPPDTIRLATHTDNSSSLYSKYSPRQLQLNSTRLPGLSMEPRDTLTEYFDLTKQYTGRVLTNPQDIIFAYQGILSVFERALHTRVLAGLPIRYLDECLLWVHAQISRDSTDAPTPHLPFPSWSWAAWQKGTDFCFAEGRSIRSDLIWFLLSEETMPATLYRIETEATRDLGDEERYPLPVPQPCPMESLSRSFLMSPEMRTDITDCLWNDRHLLSCWTAVATFQVLDETFRPWREKLSWWKPFEECTNLTVSDNCRQTAGSVLMHNVWVKENFRAPQDFEFMYMSNADVAISPDAGTENLDGIRYFDCEAYPVREWCFVNVMLIARNGDEVTRLGIGTIHEDAWVAANPVAMFLKLL